MVLCLGDQIVCNRCPTVVVSQQSAAGLCVVEVLAYLKYAALGPLNTVDIVVQLAIFLNKAVLDIHDTVLINVVLCLGDQTVGNRCPTVVVSQQSTAGGGIVIVLAYLEYTALGPLYIVFVVIESTILLIETVFDVTLIGVGQAVVLCEGLSEGSFLYVQHQRGGAALENSCIDLGHSGRNVDSGQLCAILECNRIQYH